MKSRLGFTLMELLIVTTLIAVLAVVALLLFNPKKQIEKAWDGKRKTELSQLKKVLEDWYNDKQCYPRPAQICYDSASPLPDGSYTCHICGNESSSPPFSPYLSRLPCDPEHSRRKYLYQVNDTSCPSWWRIYTTLSVTSDPVIAEAGCTDGCGPGTVGFVYNYGVSSPNVGLESGPGDFYCLGIDNCSWYDKSQKTCTPSFSSPNCDGYDINSPKCQTAGTCVPK